MSATKVDNTPRDFHVSIVGEEKVEQFESKFPQIVKDEACILHIFSDTIEDMKMNLSI